MLKISDADNFATLLLRRAAESAAQPALFIHGPLPESFKPFPNPITWGEVCNRVRFLAAGLLSLGLKKGHRVALLGHNTLNYFLMDWATQALGGVSVPIHPQTPNRNIKMVLQETEAMFLFVHSQEGWEVALDLMHIAPHLQRIITGEKVRGDAEMQLDIQELEVRGYQGLEKAGMLGNPENDLLLHASESVEKNRDCLLLIDAHARFIPLSNAMLIEQMLLIQKNLPCTSSNIAVNQLPFSTLQGRIELLWHLVSGGKLVLGCSNGPVAARHNPTLHFGGGEPTPGIAQTYWFIENRPTTVAGMHTLLALPQSCGLMLLDGKALGAQEIQVASDGELWIQGAQTFFGYGLATAEAEMPAEEKEGPWIKTGVFVEKTASGLQILGLRDERVVPSSGEPFYLNGMETLLRRIPGILQAVVVGRERPYLAALLYVDADRKDQGHFWPQNSEINTWVQSKLDILNMDLPEERRIRRFALLPHPLSFNRGELTELGSPIRDVIEKNHQSLANGLFA